MKDVTSKPQTLRSARARSSITVPESCIPLVRERRTEKGDAMEAARFAATMAVKRTWELIPLCHPLPIQEVRVCFALGTTRIDTEVLVRAIANTGVEMEALTGASVAALTFYDMLKPHAGTRLSIGDVHLIEKLGGKSHYRRRVEPPVEGAIIATSASEAVTRTASLVRERLAAAGIRCPEHESVETGSAELAASIRRGVATGARMIATVGGTGLTAGDHGVEMVRPLLERELPGVIEAARSHVQQRTPFGMLHRGAAGLIGRTVVVTLPGDAGTASGYLDALIPGLVHLLDELRTDAHARDQNL